MGEHGYLENTIIVFNAAHGTHLGDFGLVQKQTFFEPAVAVPCLFWWPGGFAQGKTLETPVETGSLIPTLLDDVSIPIAEVPVGDGDCIAPGRDGLRRSQG